MHKKIIDTDALADQSDHDLLIKVAVLLGNHLAHSDMLVKIALTAALIGAVNFGIGLFFVLITTGVISIGQGG